MGSSRCNQLAVTMVSPRAFGSVDLRDWYKGIGSSRQISFWREQVHVIESVGSLSLGNSEQMLVSPNIVCQSSDPQWTYLEMGSGGS